MQRFQQCFRMIDYHPDLSHHSSRLLVLFESCIKESSAESSEMSELLNLRSLTTASIGNSSCENSSCERPLSYVRELDGSKSWVFKPLSGGWDGYILVWLKIGPLLWCYQAWFSIVRWKVKMSFIWGAEALRYYLLASVVRWLPSHPSSLSLLSSPLFPFIPLTTSHPPTTYTHNNQSINHKVIT